mgnify:CR=1 FL=1
MIDNYSSLYTPGIFVINTDKENEWGIGQIQSSINNLITINFENVGKKTINISKFISLEQTIEKIMEIKLYCFYCKEKCELIYKDIFAKKQWTLDRINNNQGHNWDNVVISCLECNIKRGDMDSERFKRGKQIQIVRKQF